MCAGPKYEYVWSDGRKTIACPAPVYIDYLMTWVHEQLDDENVFPSQIGSYPWLFTSKEVPLACIFLHLQEIFYEGWWCRYVCYSLLKFMVIFSAPTFQRRWVQDSPSHRISCSSHKRLWNDYFGCMPMCITNISNWLVYNFDPLFKWIYSKSMKSPSIFTTWGIFNYTISTKLTKITTA